MSPADPSEAKSDPSTIVLLIDHNDRDRTYYADRVKSGLQDCQVLEANDGHSGLELYKSTSVDCIVTELNLPDMSGFELLLEVVPQASQPVVAVIILAGFAYKTLADIARKHGTQELLAKRLMSGDELVHSIRQAIARVRPTRKG